MGPSGKVSFSPYVEAAHAGLLVGDNPGAFNGSQAVEVNIPDGHRLGGANNFCLKTILEQDLLNWDNPYENFNAYDPDDDLETAEMAISRFSSASIVSELTLWSQYVDLAKEMVDEVFESEAELTAEVATFRERREDDLAKSYNRASASFFDANATTSTVFPMAFAALEASFNRDVADYEAKLRLQQRTESDSKILDAVTQLISMHNANLAGLGNVAQMAGNFAGNKIRLKEEQRKQDIAYTLEEIGWNLSLLNNGGKALGMLSGMPGMNQGTPLFITGLSTLATLAATIIPLF